MLNRTPMNRNGITMAEEARATESVASDPDEDLIRRKAYELWLAEGKPEGRDRDHSELARELVAIEDFAKDDVEAAPDR